MVVDGMCYFVSSCWSQECNIGLDKDWSSDKTFHNTPFQKYFVAKDEKYFCCGQHYQFITCLLEQKLILLVQLTSLRPEKVVKNYSKDLLSSE